MDMESCEDDLKRLCSMLDRKSDVSGWRKLQISAGWPFSEKETANEISKLHRYQEILHRLISAELLSLGTKTSSDIQSIHQKTDFIQNELADWKTNQDCLGVLQWLSPLDFTAKQTDIFARHTSDTCAWLLQDSRFLNWADKSASNRALWCPGNLGAGKTVATSVVINRLVEKYETAGDISIAFVYSDYNARAEQTSAALLGSLLKQLVLSSRSFPSYLVRGYKELCHNKTPQALDIDGALKLLNHQCHRTKVVYVLVDALDELDDQNQSRETFLHAFLQLQKVCPTVSLFITGRRHLLSINEALKDAVEIGIEASQDDLAAYVASKISTSQDLSDIVADNANTKHKVISTVVDLAKGHFHFTWIIYQT